MDRASGVDTQTWMADWMLRVYYLMPFMTVLVMNFVSKDGAMSFPWQFQVSLSHLRICHRNRDQ